MVPAHSGCPCYFVNWLTNSCCYIAISAGAATATASITITTTTTTTTASSIVNIII